MPLDIGIILSNVQISVIPELSNISNISLGSRRQIKYYITKFILVHVTHLLKILIISCCVDFVLQRYIILIQSDFLLLCIFGFWDFLQP